MIQVKETINFLDWFNNLNTKEKSQVKSRINRIEEFEHFGDVKNLGEGLAELRWKNGWRIYFCSMGYKKIILIIGGHKNEQEKDIKKSRILIKRLTTN